MHTGQIYDKALNKSLDEVLLQFHELYEDCLHNKQIKTYNTLADLGLEDARATIEDVVRALPSYSMIQLDVYVGTHLKMDIPHSGLLQIIRAGASVKKAHIIFRNENIALYRMFNQNATPPLQDWRMDGWTSIRVSAGSWKNSLANINIYGVHYYFSRAETAKLTDTPSDLGGNAFSIVTNHFSDSDQCEQVLVENTRAARQWRRIVHNKTAYEWTRSIQAAGDTMTGDLQIIKDGAKATAFSLQNSVRRGGLQISSSGNLGIYDDTLERWVIRANNDGAIFLGKSPESNANSDEAASTKWVRHLLVPHRQTYTKTITGNSTWDDGITQQFTVEGEVVVYPNGKIEQFFHFKKFRVPWFGDEEHISGRRYYGHEIPIQLWTAMPNKITNVTGQFVRPIGGPFSFRDEAAERINPRWGIYKQGSLKDKCYVNTVRWTGEGDVEIDMLVKVEGY